MTKTEMNMAKTNVLRAIRKAMHVFIISLHQDGYSNEDIATWASIFKGSSVDETSVASTINKEQSKNRINKNEVEDYADVKLAKDTAEVAFIFELYERGLSLKQISKYAIMFFGNELLTEEAVEAIIAHK